MVLDVNHITLSQMLHMTFKPLVGKSVLGSITAVEFFSDRQLDFLTDDGACQPYQNCAAADLFHISIMRFPIMLQEEGVIIHCGKKRDTILPSLHIAPLKGWGLVGGLNHCNLFCIKATIEPLCMKPTGWRAGEGKRGRKRNRVWLGRKK
ncbi:probable JmjC domain-containing histone demethylation protein 2C isoform X1 [Tachysurus ichikawai]